MLILGEAGAGFGSTNIHIGAFDNGYYTNGNGHLFVCGKTPGFVDRPAIHRIIVTSGVMNTVSDGNLDLVFTSSDECSPVSEFNIGTTDRIFFSVTNNNNPCACSGGGVMSLVLTGSWPPAAVTNALDASGGTSGIVVDNATLTLGRRIRPTRSTRYHRQERQYGESYDRRHIGSH